MAKLNKILPENKSGIKRESLLQIAAFIDCFKRKKPQEYDELVKSFGKQYIEEVIADLKTNIRWLR